MRAGLAPGFPLSVRVRLMNKGSGRGGYSTRRYGPRYAIPAVAMLAESRRDINFA